MYMHLMCKVAHLHVALVEVAVDIYTFGAHAQEGYGTCLVCVSVCYHSIGNICHFYAETEVRRGLS